MARGWHRAKGESRRKIPLEDVLNLRQEWALGNVTHSELARKYGVSRARIGQILGPVRKDLGPDALSILEASHRFHMSSTTIQFLIKTGEILRFAQKISATELADWIERTKQRPCIICGKPVETANLHTKSCPNHRRTAGNNEYHKYPYRVWSEKRKEKFRQLMQEWRERNPERARVNQKRATRVYYLMKHRGLSREEARRISHAENPLEGLPPLVPSGRPQRGGWVRRG